MRLLILDDHPNYGGVSSASAALLDGLARADLLVFRASIYDRFFRRWYGKVICLFRALLKVITDKSEIVICMHFEAILIGLLGRFFRRRTRFIFVVHTDLRSYYETTVGIKRFCFFVFLKIIRYECLVFVSKEAESRAKDYFGLRDSRAIYNISPTIMKSASRRDHAVSNFGVVSRLHAEKNIDRVIKIFDKIWLENNSVRLLIFGSGPELERLESYAKLHGCAESVIFKGYEADTHKIYSQLDALIGLSSMEGFSLAILEALEMGVPVFHSDCSSGPREIMSPTSDPELKTESYEDVGCGVLVKNMSVSSHYDVYSEERDGECYAALNMFYQRYCKLRRPVNVDLRPFQADIIVSEWRDLFSSISLKNSRLA